jgi:hypothetical protein
MNKDLLCEKINEPSEFLDYLHYYFQKGLLELQTMHSEGKYHGDIRPDFIQCNDSECILESSYTKASTSSFSPNDMFVPPEIALGYALSDGMDLDDAIHSYQTKSPAIDILTTYCPMIATQYTTAALKSLIGKPMPLSYSDCWAYGMSFLYALDCMKDYNKFMLNDFWKDDCNDFFECLQSLLCLKTRKIPILKKKSIWEGKVCDLSDGECNENSSKSCDASLTHVVSSDASCSSTHPPVVARGRTKLSVPIHHGAHNKTRKALRN